MDRNPRTGHVLLILVVFMWGANVGIVKAAYDEIPPILFAAIRFTISGIFLLAITFFCEKGLRIRRADWTKVVLLGGLGLGLYQILWSVGLSLTSASNSALILSTQPLLGALYVDLKKDERVEKGQYGGMLIALTGVILVILKPTVHLRVSLATLIGDLLNLLASFCGAVFFSARAKPLLRTYSPLRLMSYCMVTGSILLWMAVPFAAWSPAWGQIGKAWWSMAYAIVIGGILGHVVWYDAIGRIGVTQTLLYQFFIPIWAVLFNHLFLGEEVSLQQILGGALILFGVYRSLRV